MANITLARDAGLAVILAKMGKIKSVLRFINKGRAFLV